MAVKGRRSDRFPLAITIISVFCRVRMDTSASIKEIVRSKRISLSADLRRLFKLTAAIITLYVVYDAMEIAGINVMLTGFCSITIKEIGTIRLMFKSNIKKWYRYNINRSKTRIY